MAEKLFGPEANNHRPGIRERNVYRSTTDRGFHRRAANALPEDLPGFVGDGARLSADRFTRQRAGCRPVDRLPFLRHAHARRKWFDNIH